MRAKRLKPHERAAVLTAYLRGEVTARSGTARAASRGLLRQVEPSITEWRAVRVYVLTLKGARVAAQLLYNGRGWAAIDARRQLWGVHGTPLDRTGGRPRSAPRYSVAFTVRSTSNATPVADQVDRLPPGRYTVVATSQDPEPPAAPADGTPRAKE